MNLESATLVLRTSAINTSRGDINVGNFNNNCSWAINLQTVLGSMYNKYSRFKICLTSFGNASGGTLTDINRIININIAGLQWNNQSYDTTTGTIISSVNIASVDMINQGRSVNFAGETGFVFFKPNSSDVVIRIFLTRVFDDTLQAVQYPNCVFCFSIYGIEE